MARNYAFDRKVGVRPGRDQQAKEKAAKREAKRQAKLAAKAEKAKAKSGELTGDDSPPTDH